MKRLTLVLAAIGILGAVTACGTAPGSTNETRPTVTKTVRVPGPTVTKTITKTVTNSAMTVVSVPDPTGAPYNDTGWQTTIPCLNDDGQLLIGGGDGGVQGSGVVPETCTFTVVAVQPASSGQLAVIVKDAGGTYASFALTPAG